MLPNSIPVPFPINFRGVPKFAYYKGRDTWTPDIIVIHIAEGTRESVEQTFSDPAMPKSTHFLVNQDGTLWQFVSTSDTAYGNGIVDHPTAPLVVERLRTKRNANPNLYTISIEHEGYSSSDINGSMYETTAKLVAYLARKWNIPIDEEHVIPHHAIEESKTCPGLISVSRIIALSNYLLKSPTGDNCVAPN